MTLHPLHTTTLLRDSYARYLKTIYPFQDARLRDQFWAALGETDDRLVKGPLLEVSPPYRPGPSLAGLVAEGVLSPDFAKLCEVNAALPYRRSLYAHQAAAVRRAVAGHNLIVATGTGSGKTEAFLIPILDHLLRERAKGTLATPGVRALLLYPMNALANDQMDRLRRLLGRFPEITFGRYTGETAYTRDAALDAYLRRQRFTEEREPQPPPANELLSRDEMRAAPPHLLLTNYAMLEYLLLRPHDTALFDGLTGGHWRFIVTDEAHVYDGAQGIEVGMLLRRLKERVLHPGQPPLRCIATSATLGGPDDRALAARFAAELFGEPFVSDDVIAAERQPVAALGQAWGVGGPTLYAGLAALPHACAPADVAAVAERAGAAANAVAAARAAPDEAAALYALLAGDERLRRLRDLLAEPRLLTDVAPQLFNALPPAAAHEATVQLVELAVRAKAAEDDAPLLPARYHVFARATAGAYACLNDAAHTPPGPRLWLDRREACPECQAAVFELATCARCGATYVVGELEPHDLPDERVDRLQPLRGDLSQGESQSAYFLLEATLPDVNEDDLDETGEEAEDEKWQAYTLCLTCGVMVEGNRPLPCGHGDGRGVYRLNRKKGDGKMVCGKCQTRAQNAIYRVLTGQDAPISVLTTQLYAELPPADDPQVARLPGQGRKLLIFSDSRQNAAFLAPYLERTGNTVLYRRLILEMLTEDETAAGGELRLDSLAKILQQRAVDAGALDRYADLYERQTETRKWLTREMVASDVGQSLEGLGLLRFDLLRPEGWATPAPLLAPPWSLSETEAWGLIGLLLDTVRRRGGLRYPEGVDPADDFFAPRNRPVYLMRRTPEKEERPREALQGWLPRRGENTRSGLLDKLLQQTAPHLSQPERHDAALRLLNDLWDSLRAGPWARLWQAEKLGRAGSGYQLSYDAWRWAAVTGDAPVWRCRRCQGVAHHNLRGICPVYGCEGELEPLRGADLRGDNHHYRYLYQRLRPAFLNVEEHTAQWTSDKAAEIQQRFIEGQVNVLSCSTTFELGVDVGALSAVLMRNVPPTTANYVQRAGRAGRRRDTPAYVLTFAQRRSHDLAHYTRPERLVAGRVRPPAIVIHNAEIVGRHMASALIAAFLRWCVDERNRFADRKELKVGPFFAPDDGRPSGPALLAEYLRQPPETLRQSLLRIVPAALHEELHVTDWRWVEGVTNAAGTGHFDVAAALIQEDLALFKQLGDEASARQNAEGARRARYYYGVRDTIRGRDLLNEFGRRGVLPKYGFPVDVVELHTEHLRLDAAQHVELQRDLRLALAEFAPGSEIVAAKTLWRGGGLHKLPHRELVAWHYVVCKACGRLNRWKGEEPPAVCIGCDGPLMSKSGEKGTFLIPEFGFLAAPESGGKPGESRPPRSYTSRVYFDKPRKPEYLPNADAHWEEFRPVPELSGPEVALAMRYSHYGELVVVNHGPLKRGFQVCQSCGYAQPAQAETGRRGRGKTTAEHANPRTGRPCGTPLYPYHLGHDFITDVLELRVGGSLAVPDAPEPEKSRWWSVLYALLEGASEALQIRRTDLNGTLYTLPDGVVPALVLYDDVPGGAGHVRRVAEAWPAVFAAALERVSRCSCGPETACHECLWNYYNQPLHPRLARGLAEGFLRGALGV